MNILHVSLFGCLRIHFESPATELKLTRTVQELFAYLLLFRHRAHPRDVLADLFWKDQNQEKARGSLNTALWRLRSALETRGAPADPYILSSRSGEVSFNPQSSYWLDVAIFERQATRSLALPLEKVETHEIELLEQALQLYTGELLEGFYDDWALRERERVRALYLNSLAYLMQYYRGCGSYEQGLHCGRRILEVDPLREEIHREMIRLYEANGQRSLASRQYELCRQVLQSELGIEPMEETKILRWQLVAPSAVVPEPGGQVRLSEVLAQLRQTAQAISQLQEQLWSAIETVEALIRRPAK